MITVRYDKSKKLACINSIFVSFPYDEFIVNTLRSYPDRVYHNTTKEWELPQEALEYLKGKIKDKFKIIGKPQIEEEKEIKEYPLPKKLKTKLYKFQEEDYQVLMNHDKYLLLNETGTGKGLLGIAIALGREALGEIEHCLVIVCVNGLKYNWKNEVETHTTSTVKVLGETHKKNISTQDKLDSLNNLDTFFVTTNIESLRQKEILEKMKKLVKTGKVMVVVDEIHKNASNPGSQQGKALLQLAKYCKYFYGLTGTPLINSVLQAYVPLKCVGRETTNFSQFKSRYILWGGFGNYSVVGYRNLEELQMKIDMVSIRRRKRDILDLPPQVFIDEYVELGVKQRKLYEEVKQNVLDHLNLEVMTMNPLSQLIRLRQVTAFTSILSDVVNESAKFVRLKELLEETEDKVVIFSNWTQVTDRLFEKLQVFNPALVTGQVKNRDRENEIQKFKNDNSCRVIVGTSNCLGTGFTLTEASTMIFMDEMWHYAGMKQCYDRIYRIGTKDTTTIYTLIAKNTIDEYIHSVVKRKRALGDAIIDKKYDLNDKRVLEYLITGDEKIMEELEDEH